MTAYVLSLPSGQFAALEDENDLAAPDRLVALVKAQCPEDSVTEIIITGSPSAPAWVKAIDSIEDYCKNTCLITMASKGEVRKRIMSVQQSKIRDLANETYVNRVKTSDRKQKAVLDFIKG